MASTTTLEPFCCLGMACIPHSGPYYVNDASIVHPVGNQVIQLSLDTSERIFLLESRLFDKGSRHTKMTAFSVSNDGTFLALASNRHNDEPILIVYSLQTNNELMSFTIPDTGEIHFTAFHRSLKLGLYLVTDPRKYKLAIFDLTTK